MTFVLPIETNLHTSNADQNVGSIGGSTTLILRQKTAGNLPITTSSGRVQFNPATGAEGVFFGTIDSTTPGSVDSSTDAVLMIWSVQFNSPNRIQIDSQSNGGIRFWLGSGCLMFVSCTGQVPDRFWLGYGCTMFRLGSG
jgi:hypothetical protein